MTAYQHIKKRYMGIILEKVMPTGVVTFAFSDMRLVTPMENLRVAFVVGYFVDSKFPLVFKDELHKMNLEVQKYYNAALVDYTVYT
jgi:hypothetical protein